MIELVQETCPPVRFLHTEVRSGAHTNPKAVDFLELGNLGKVGIGGIIATGG
jgi:hypothetical protein